MSDSERQFTALVVDDTKTARYIMHQLLVNKLNMNVVEAVDGRDALLKLASCEPDLLIADLSMPNLDSKEGGITSCFGCGN